MAIILCKVLPEPGHRTIIAIMPHPYRVSSIYSCEENKNLLLFYFYFLDIDCCWISIGWYPKPRYQNQYQEGKQHIGTSLLDHRGKKTVPFNRQKPRAEAGRPSAKNGWVEWEKERKTVVWGRLLWVGSSESGWAQLGSAQIHHGLDAVKLVMEKQISVAFFDSARPKVLEEKCH